MHYDGDFENDARNFQCSEVTRLSKMVFGWIEICFLSEALAQIVAVGRKTMQ